MRYATRIALKELGKIVWYECVINLDQNKFSSDETDDPPFMCNDQNDTNDTMNNESLSDCTEDENIPRLPSIPDSLFSKSTDVNKKWEQYM